jgi:hypothetical protein
MVSYQLCRAYYYQIKRSKIVLNSHLYKKNMILMQINCYHSLTFILYIVENADAGNAIDYKDNEAGRGTEAEGENEEYN